MVARCGARLQSVVMRREDDAALGICILELSRCCSFSLSRVCRIVYLDQLHRLAGISNLTGVPRKPCTRRCPWPERRKTRRPPIRYTSIYSGPARRTKEPFEVSTVVGVAVFVSPSSGAPSLGPVILRLIGYFRQVSLPVFLRFPLRNLGIYPGLVFPSNPGRRR